MESLGRCMGEDTATTEMLEYGLEIMLNGTTTNEKLNGLLSAKTEWPNFGLAGFCIAGRPAQSCASPSFVLVLRTFVLHLDMSSRFTFLTFTNVCLYVMIAPLCRVFRIFFPTNMMVTYGTAVRGSIRES